MKATYISTNYVKVIDNLVNFSVIIAESVRSERVQAYWFYGGVSAVVE